MKDVHIIVSLFFEEILVGCIVTDEDEEMNYPRGEDVSPHLRDTSDIATQVNLC